MDMIEAMGASIHQGTLRKRRDEMRSQMIGLRLRLQATGGERVHELKCAPGPFDALQIGVKRHEIRQDDRDYREGDVLWLRHWDPVREYTGRSLFMRVTYKSSGGTWGLPDDLCVLSVAPLFDVEVVR